MWPDLPSDARSLDTGLAPRRNTEGGIQPADKSLINRRLSAPSPALCSQTPNLIKNRPISAIRQRVAAASSIDYGHKSW